MLEKKLTWKNWIINSTCSLLEWDNRDGRETALNYHYTSYREIIREKDSISDPSYTDITPFLWTVVARGQEQWRGTNMFPLSYHCHVVMRIIHKISIVKMAT